MTSLLKAGSPSRSMTFEAHVAWVGGEERKNVVELGFQNAIALGEAEVIALKTKCKGEDKHSL